MAKKTTKRKNVKKKTPAKKVVKKTSKKSIAKQTSLTKPEKKRKKETDIFLRNFMLVIVGIMIFLVIIAIISQKEESLEYKGVEYEVVEFCDAGPPCLVTYNTKVPVTYQGKPAEYNFFLRNNPSRLARTVPFNGDFQLANEAFIEITFDINCEGFEKIAVQNFLTLHNVAGVKVSDGEGILSEDLKDDQVHILIQEASKTNINQVNSNCYVINIKDCEILEGTERYMIEMFAKLNEKSS